MASEAGRLAPTARRGCAHAALQATSSKLLRKSVLNSGCPPGFARNMCTGLENVSTHIALQAFDKNSVNQSIASFLVTRPPIAFLGFGWESDMRDWRPEFLWQVGEPQGPCTEAPSGVFTRPWSYGDAVVNCNTWTATVPTSA